MLIISHIVRAEFQTLCHSVLRIWINAFNPHSKSAGETEKKETLLRSHFKYNTHEVQRVYCLA